VLLKGTCGSPAVVDGHIDDYGDQPERRGGDEPHLVVGRIDNDRVGVE
jgi:hypothetical protein